MRLPAPLTLFTLLVCLALPSVPAHAEQPRFNQVSLRAEASREIPHDLMQVTLFSEAREGDPASLAARITENINQAITVARKVDSVEISLGNRHSYPVYSDNGKQIVAWRERAELHLQSADFAALAQLRAQLPGDLQTASMGFSIAGSTRRASEDQLLKEAIAAFTARAELATAALGGSAYKLVSLSLDSQGFAPPMPMHRAATSMAMADAAPVAEIEAGNSQVTLIASGVIEVQMP
jgi:predicted secreted protein